MYFLSIYSMPDAAGSREYAVSKAETSWVYSSEGEMNVNK